MVLGNEKLKELGYANAGPASVDLTLANQILVPKAINGFVRLGSKVQYSLVPFSEERPFILVPGAFVLGATVETVNIPHEICAFVQGRSSIGRIGLSVQNAGFVDPGFHGTITLELKNDSRNPIAPVPGYRIAQLVFIDANGVTTPYDGKYNGQIAPTGSRMHMDKEVTKV